VLRWTTSDQTDISIALRVRVEPTYPVNPMVIYCAINVQHTSISKMLLSVVWDEQAVKQLLRCGSDSLIIKLD